MEISNGVHQQHDWWNFAENDWLPSKMNEKYNQLFNAQWYRRYHSRNKTFEHLLQPQRLLERSCGHPKARQSGQCFWKSGSWLAAETSAVASLSASLSPHSSAQVRCSHAKQSSPSRLTFFAWRHSGPRAGRKTYKYALAVVDSASHHIKAEPTNSKEATDIAGTFRRIYTRGPLRWGEFLQVDPSGEFMGVVTKLMKVNGTTIRLGRVDIRRDQAIVERFNRTLTERLFGYQYAVEMQLPKGQRSSEWVLGFLPWSQLWTMKWLIDW